MSSYSTSPVAGLSDVFPADELLTGLLEVSLTGVVLFTPLYAVAGGPITDYAFQYVNPAAQQMLRLPAHPTQTYLEQFPESIENGAFAFLCGVFASGQPGRYERNYQADGYDNYFYVAARRVGAGLLLSVTDTSDHPRTAVEVALRESQAREQAARAEAELQRQQLETLFMQAPACVARLTGPEHRFTLLNPLYQQLFSPRVLLGRTIREALPELEGQSFYDLLDHVYRTGETYRGNEQLAYLNQTDTNRLDPVYFNFVYQAIRDPQGTITGIFIFAYDVTEQVQARQRLEVSEQDLAATNEELAAINEELAAAHAATETQRQQLYAVLMQLPANLAIFQGPQHVYELMSPQYAQSLPGRHLLGRPLRHALPELEGQQYFELFDQVYQTGQSYYGSEVPTWVNFAEAGRPELRYYNVALQPLRDGQGTVNGLINFAYDVTPQVTARRRLEHSEQELAATNEELQAANEELHATNEELFQTELQLRELNQELEARVEERTAELRAATREAEQQRETFYQVFEQTPALISLLRGPEHRYAYYNASFQQLFPEQKLLGRRVIDVYPAGTGQDFVQLLDQVYQTGESYRGREVPYTRLLPDGAAQEVYFDFTYQPFRENGEVVGISVFSFDVTEQVRARQQVALQETQQREQLQQILGQLPAAIVALEGPEHRLTFFNSRYNDLVGGRAQLGRTVQELLPEVAGQGFIDLLDSVYATGEPFLAVEAPIELHNSATGEPEHRYLDFVYQPMAAGQGRTPGILVFVVDSTEKVRARQQVAAQQERLNLLFMQAPISICILSGPELAYELVNPSYQQVFPGRMLLGRPLLEALPELAGQPAVQHLRQVYETGHTRREYGIPTLVAQHEGEPPRNFYLDYVLQARHNSQGQVDGVLVFMLDVTDQTLARQQVQHLNEELAAINQQLRTTNQELETANRQLRRTNQDLDNFVYAASHDLKQPVNNLAGLFEELNRVVTFQNPDEEQLLVPLITETLRQLSTNINDLAVLGQTQPHAPQAAAETVNLAELTQDVLQSLQPQIAAARGRITQDFEARPFVHFSRANLRTILLNLIGNSLKYADPARPARVHVSVWVDEDGHSVLRVDDNGLGLDTEQHGNELFQLFRRFHTSHAEGTGVGLYLVNRIVQANGGRIEVESKPGEGTTFRVFLRE